MQVVLCGQSYDATAALFTASMHHPAVKGVVALYPFWYALFCVADYTNLASCLFHCAWVVLVLVLVLVSVSVLVLVLVSVPVLVLVLVIVLVPVPVPVPALVPVPVLVLVFTHHWQCFLQALHCHACRSISCKVQGCV